MAYRNIFKVSSPTKSVKKGIPKMAWPAPPKTSNPQKIMKSTPKAKSARMLYPAGRPKQVKPTTRRRGLY